MDALDESEPVAITFPWSANLGLHERRPEGLGRFISVHGDVWIGSISRQKIKLLVSGGYVAEKFKSRTIPDRGPPSWCEW